MVLHDESGFHTQPLSRRFAQKLASMGREEDLHRTKGSIEKLTIDRETESE